MKMLVRKKLKAGHSDIARSLGKSYTYFNTLNIELMNMIDRESTNGNIMIGYNSVRVRTLKAKGKIISAYDKIKKDNMLFDFASFILSLGIYKQRDSVYKYEFNINTSCRMGEMRGMRKADRMAEAILMFGDYIEDYEKIVK